ncbi:hypothetical protein [Parvicella tangerina]|uniref:Uncharacterized protein n=1 Tax=Parvicella tangerina TaxID=2829795 RepID=A0A916NEQ8_9FLAO|nr:hypothetical protein [Parvicella tangerina]CAG5076796.1 hypothetical protein CRYO30217_00203 [Parvicella tangerina]
MKRRDLIKDQIEQLGKVLTKMLDTFFSLKSKGQIGTASEHTTQTLKEELNIDIDVFLQLPEGELQAFFEARNFTNDHLNDLAKLFLEYAKVELAADKKTKAKRWLEQTKFMLQLNMSNEHSFSLSEEPNWQGISFDHDQSALIKDVEALLNSHGM